MSSWYDPPLGEASQLARSYYQKENFRQEFQVLGNEHFNKDNIAVLQVLYESYTSKYAPLSVDEAKSNIETKCTIYHQSYSDGYIDYEMVWESLYHNVSYYHELFQNWTLFHQDNILQDWNLLLPQSDVIQLTPPTVIPRNTPIESYTNTSSAGYPMEPGWVSTYNPTIVPITTGTTTENSSNSPNNGVIVVISIMIVIVVVIVGIGLLSVCFFYRNRSVATSNACRDPCLR